MGERVTISYRGAAYELGRGKGSYGIWNVGAPRTEPVGRWPDTPEGWNAAWSRFTTIETPDNIVAARAVSGGLTISAVSAGVGVAAAMLAIGVLCGVVSLFPGYVGGTSLASQPPQLVPHVIYFAAWTLSAALILVGGARLRAGALLGLGVSIVTFGFFLTDIGEVIAGSGMDAGLWFGLIGWLACAAGSVLAFRIGMRRAAQAGTAQAGTAQAGTSQAGTSQAGTAQDGTSQAGTVRSRAGQDRAAIGRPGWLRGYDGYDVARAALVVLAGIGAAVAFAPSWDSYLLHTPTSFIGTPTGGYAFANPGAIIAGNLVVMIVFVLVVIAAAAWRPVRMGAILLAGAVIPMAAQAISALVQIGEATSPLQFGITPSQASAAGLTITNGLTAAFWIYCLLIVVLAVSCAWMFSTPPSAATAAAGATVPVQMPAAPVAWDGSRDADDSWAAEDEAEDEADETDEIAEPHYVAEPHDAAPPRHLAEPDDADSVDFGKPAR